MDGAFLTKLFLCSQAQILTLTHSFIQLFYVVADSIVGFIPLIGDAIDFLFMSNLKNLALLEDFLIKSPQWAVVVAPPGSFQPTGKQQLGFWRSLWASWLGTKRQ